MQENLYFGVEKKLRFLSTTLFRPKVWEQNYSETHKKFLFHFCYDFMPFLFSTLFPKLHFSRFSMKHTLRNYPYNEDRDWELESFSFHHLKVFIIPLQNFISIDFLINEEWHSKIVSGPKMQLFKNIAKIKKYRKW